MGYGILAEPGTEFGPCAEPCQHKDCAATRAKANENCIECGETIGYGTKYYQEEDGLIHYRCAKD